MTIMAGATKLNKAWWRTLNGGIFLAATFSTWLFHEGVYDIGKLCLYCMLVWLVTFALLWLVTAYCIEQKYINLGARLNKLLSYKYEFITSTYLLIFMLLFFRWSDYWTSLF
jgi:flagellar biosynthesis protein FlhB